MTDEPTLAGAAGSAEAAEIPVGADVAVGADDPADPPGEAATRTLDPGDASLLALIDRLGSLLDRSDLSELAVESGGTRLVLRKPVAIAPAVVGGGAAGMAGDGTGALAGGPATSATAAGGTAAAEPPGRPSVKAPLTGVWYSSPAPGSAPFVAAGREVAIGQVIGLIEAMKLFNEIKSDIAGRVVRVIPESGALVKAKQPLIEVEPL
jgi:acetyl-CoA carboxylase biotin carboxyl carrier protein